jgi:NDP-sugar pyrophosphorylase family protein
MLNVLIPMSGRGQRFKDAGYSLPKPFIDVNGKPMIQRVIENLNIEGKFIFLTLKDHYSYLQNILPTTCNDYQIITVEQITQGAACTCLLAESLINNDNQLIIANSDQLVEWNTNNFLQTMIDNQADGGILTFTATEPKWSFAKVIDGTNIISEVAEKNPISDKATTGIYWFKKGKYFVEGAQQMINKNIRTNNEFYVCPVFNELINEKLKILNYPINKMIGLGTPEDLELYLQQ